MLKKNHIMGRHNRPWGVLLASWVPLEKAVEKSIEKAVWITFSTARCAWIWWIASCSAKLGQWLKTEKVLCFQRSLWRWWVVQRHAEQATICHFFILVDSMICQLIPQNFAAKKGKHHRSLTVSPTPLPFGRCGGEMKQIHFFFEG